MIVAAAVALALAVATQGAAEPPPPAPPPPDAIPTPIEPREIEPDKGDKGADKTPALPPADARQHGKKHKRGNGSGKGDGGVDEDRDLSALEIAALIGEFGVGTAGVVAAPFVANAAVKSPGAAAAIAASTVPGVMGLATGVAITLVGVAFLEGADEARRYDDPCGCGCGPACGDVLESIGSVLVVTGVVATVAAPLAFFATTTTDKAITGRTPNTLPAIAAATAGAAVGVGGMVGLGILHDDVIDGDPPSALVGFSIVSAGLGIGILGATTGYVLAR